MDIRIALAWLSPRGVACPCPSRGPSSIPRSIYLSILSASLTLRLASVSGLRGYQAGRTLCNDSRAVLIARHRGLGCFSLWGRCGAEGVRLGGKEQTFLRGQRGSKRKRKGGGGRGVAWGTGWRPLTGKAPTSVCHASLQKSSNAFVCTQKGLGWSSHHRAPQAGSGCTTPVSSDLPYLSGGGETPTLPRIECHAGASSTRQRAALFLP